MANLKIKNAPLIPDDQLENSIKLPTGGKGNYAVSLGQIANYTKNSLSLAVQSSIDELRNTKADKANTYTKEEVDEALSTKAPQETTYTKLEVDSALSTKAPQATTYTKAEVDTTFAAYVGGRKGFTTLALAQAGQSTLTANTVVDVTNDPDPAKNGTYQWNGTTLTKSAHDPLTQSKEYTDNLVTPVATESATTSSLLNNSIIKSGVSNPTGSSATQQNGAIGSPNQIYINEDIKTTSAGVLKSVTLNIRETTGLMKLVFLSKLTSTTWKVEKIVEINATGFAQYQTVTFRAGEHFDSVEVGKDWHFGAHRTSGYSAATIIADTSKTTLRMISAASATLGATLSNVGVLMESAVQINVEVVKSEKLSEIEAEILTNKQSADTSIAALNDTFYQKNKVNIPFSTVVGNFKINPDGTLKAWGGMLTSNKLPVSILTENTVTIENLSTPNDPTLVLAFYDASDAFLSGIDTANNTVVAKSANIIVPANASYFRICYLTSLSTAKIYKSVNSQLTFDEIKNVEMSLGTSITKASKVKIPATFVVGNYAINNDGSLVAWGGMFTSQPILISGFSNISAENLSAKSNGGVVVAFYDVSGAFISSGLTLTSNQVVADTGLISVPSNAVTFRYCYNSALTSNALAYAISAQYAYDLLKSETNAIVKPYAGKKILSLGDSYTWLNYYGSALTETTGCTQRARGQNGNFLKSFCNDSYTGSDGNLVAEVFDATLLAQYDIVTIMGGTNDYGHGTATLGTIADTKDQNTIYGAVKFLIDKIQTLKPTIKIVFVTQPFRLQYSTETAPGGYSPNSNGLTMQNIAQAIKECASLYGCPVYDFYSLSNWNELTIKKNLAGNFNDNIYTYDGLHPRQGVGNGAYLLGQGLGRFINRL